MRRCTDLHLILHTTTNGQRRIVFKGSELWNNLPNTCKDKQSVTAFKKLLISHFIENISHL